MGVSVDQYADTPALTVDWDLEFAELETRIQNKQQ